MDQEALYRSALFSSQTRDSFQRYLRDHPNSRRVSQSDRSTILVWLTNPEARPSSQQEFSRRNYVQKTFTWDATRETLIAVAKDKKKDRDVITEDGIMDAVELVHLKNGHLGWDATWTAISESYYGILRADVIFLLKQCPVCAVDPRKRPKGRANPRSYSVEEVPSGLLSMEDILHSPSDFIEPGMLQE